MRTQEIREMEKRAEMYRRLLIWNIVFLLGLLCWGSVRGQYKWQKVYGGSNDENISTILKVKNGYIICGFSNSDSAFNKTQNSKNSSFDYWIVKTDKNGNIIWDKTYGSNSADYLNSGFITSENNIILVGQSLGSMNGDKSDTSFGSFDSWILMLDSNGNKIWDKSFGGNSGDDLYKVVETNSGYLISGNSSSSISGNKTSAINGGVYHDVWVVKIDKNGNKLWDKTYGGNESEGIGRVVKINENEFIIGAVSISDISGSKTKGLIGGIVGYGDIWVFKIDSNGNKIWDNVYGSPGQEILNDIGIFHNNVIISVTSRFSIAGYDITEQHRGDSMAFDIWIQAIDFNGAKVWNKLFGGNGSDQSGSLLFSNKNILITGSSSSNSGFDKTENSRGGNDIWAIYTDSLGNKLWDKTIGTLGNESEISNSIFTDSNSIVIGCSASGLNMDKSISDNGGKDFWLINLKIPTKKITGSIFPDFNINCLYNKPSEFNIKNILIQDKIENTYSITSDSNYSIYLYDQNKAILKVINLDSNLYVACGKDSIVVDMTGKTDTSGVDFPIRSNKTGHCINITSFSSGLLRPGRWGDYQLNYQNNAFDTAYNAYIEIEVDTAAIDSIKSPYSFTLTGNVLRFNLGHVRPFGFSSVTYSIKLKTTVIIGSSHCHRAKVFPICNLYPSTVYDSSEIQPMMRCLPNDTIEFSVKNIGLKDQKDWGLVKSYEDIIIFKVDSFRLNKGDIRIWKYKLDTNKVYTAEVFNSNFHPVTPILIRHNDLCANKRPMILSNPALNFSRHDEAKEYEEACALIRGSYDPNIKSVQPVGMFAEHYTSTGTELKYRIDFQNTGTDTAFRVVLIDTLSSFLNIASFVPGVSSHPYTLEFGGRAVKFIFDPISLIDSGTNEPASHVYVHFKIKHVAGLSPKTKIENKADIYFDYNAPIRTNTVFNTIFDTIQIYVPKASDTAKGKDTTKGKDSTSSIQGVNQTSILVFPNPTTDKFFIQMSEPVKDLSIEIYDMQGRLTKSISSTNSQTLEVSAEGMTKGIYHIRVMSGEKLVVVKKVMVE